MVVPFPTHPLTAEELWQLPDPADGGRFELRDGVLVMHPPGGGLHSQVAAALGAVLAEFAKRHSLGAFGLGCGFVLARNPDTVFAPDIHFVRASRLPGGILPPGFFEGAPDLAIEFVNPGEADREVSAKVHDYLAAGTPVVWVVRPEVRTVSVHRPNGDAHTYVAGDTLASPDAGFAPDGLDLAVASLFD